MNIVYFCANLIHLNKIRVAAVSYLNTKPLLYGIKRSPQLLSQISLIEDYPKKIGKMLVNDKVDVGLIPVAFIPQIPHWQIVSDYCIGSYGKVETVCLFSDVPYEEIENALLDYQSFSSVNLCKIIFKNFWKKKVTFVNADENYISTIGGNTAGIIIGDRVFEHKSSPSCQKYIYDLAEEWTNYTHLPFIMAAWIANKKLPQKFIENFNAANQLGLKNIDDVVNEIAYDKYDLKKYFTQDISYNIDEDKLKALHLFLQLIKEL